MDRVRRVTWTDAREDRSPGASLGDSLRRSSAPPFGRCDTEVAPERAREVTLVVEAGADRDLRDSRLGFPEAGGSPLQPKLANVLARTCSKASPELVGETRRMNADIPRQLAEVDAIESVRVEILYGVVQPTWASVVIELAFP